MYKKEINVPQCKKCGRHVFPVDTVETDQKTKKKWVIKICPKCDYKSDIEEYTDD